jgi:murein L,D-transpeptidase YafK
MQLFPRFREDNGLVIERCWLVRLVVAALILLGGAPAGICSQGQVFRDESLPAALVHLDPMRGGQYALLVEKETQRLMLYGHVQGRFKRLMEMSCSTGKVPGDKRVSGDQKTPVGVYFFTRKIHARDLAALYGSGAFPLDYPNARDRAAGRKGYAIWLHGTNKPLKERDSNGCIALQNADLDRLKPYISLQRTPIIIQERLEPAAAGQADRDRDQIFRLLSMWNAALQSGSYHEYLSFYAPDYLPDISWWPQWRRIRQKGGQPSNQSHPPAQSTFTGPIIVKDKSDFVVIFDRIVQVGDRRQPVGAQKITLAQRSGGLRIVEDVFQATTDDLAKDGRQPLLAAVSKLQREVQKGPEEIPELLAGWLKAWSGKDVKRYGSYYHRHFVSQGMNKKQWLEHKQRLNKKYRTINVTASKIRIDEGRDRSTVTFVQNYQSNVYRALGIKKLILKREGDRWKIFRESWRKRSSG